jgi:hypothetical protein
MDLTRITAVKINSLSQSVKKLEIMTTIKTSRITEFIQRRKKERAYPVGSVSGALL